MAADGNVQELQTLRDEIAELSARLIVADREKAQAGELGLSLLKEKEQLEMAHETLLKENDSVRAELERAQQQLALLRSSQRHAAASEIDHELGLLEDSAKLEAHFADKVATLETEHRHVQEQLNSYKSEVERVQQELNIVQARVVELEAERRLLRDELRELRTREQQLQSENCELEEENVALQKQVSTLKSAQIEFESMKLQIKGLLDEMVILQTSAEEAEKLRSLAEGQVKEALAAAQQEREQRLAMKKEFEQLRNQEHLASLNSLYLGIKDGQRDTVKQLETSFIADGPLGSPKPTESPARDLFSELHGDLAEQLKGAQAESQRLALGREEQRQQFAQMLSPLFQRLDISAGNGNFEDFDLPKLKEYMSLALERLEERTGPQREAKAAQKRFEQNQSCLRKTILLAARKDAQLVNAQQMLVQVCHALHGFYGELTGVTQSDLAKRKQMAELMGKLNTMTEHLSIEENRPASSPPTQNGNTAELDEDAQQQQSQHRDILSPRVASPPDFCRPLMSAQFLHELSSQSEANDWWKELLEEGDLRQRLVPEEGAEAEGTQLAFDAAAELLRSMRAAMEQRVSARMALEDKDKAELFQTISKLKSLLAVKREQVSSLRSVLRSNKSSTEGALQCLREKFESEKRLKDETMEVLRSQLKQFKEDAATFASHRAMFTARCEELQQQVESLQDSLKMAEEEKLMITQRVEELEMAAERHYQQQRSGGGTGNDREHPQMGPQKRGAPAGNRGGPGPITRTVRYPGSTSSNQQNGGGPRGKQ